MVPNLKDRKYFLMLKSYVCLYMVVVVAVVEVFSIFWLLRKYVLVEGYHEFSNAFNWIYVWLVTQDLYTPEKMQ